MNHLQNANEAFFNQIKTTRPHILIFTKKFKFLHLKPLSSRVSPKLASKRTDETGAKRVREAPLTASLSHRRDHHSHSVKAINSPEVDQLVIVCY